MNDIFSAHQAGVAGRPQNEHRRSAEFNLLSSDNNRLWGVAITRSFEKLATLRLAKYALRRIGLDGAERRESAADGGDVKLLAQDVLAEYKGNIELIESLSETYGFDYILFWQPSVYNKDTLSEFEETMAAKRSGARELFLNTTDALSSDAQLGVNPRFHDLSGLFADTADAYFLDFCHLSERGNEWVAMAIYPHLRRVVLTRDAE